MATWIVSGILGFATGGALVWFFKERIMRWYKGAEKFVGDLEDQARALRQRLR